MTFRESIKMNELSLANKIERAVIDYLTAHGTTQAGELTTQIRMRTGVEMMPLFCILQTMKEQKKIEESGATIAFLSLPFKTLDNSDKDAIISDRN